MLYVNRVFFCLLVVGAVLFNKPDCALAYPPELTSVVQASPAQITLNWPSVNSATNYVIYRSTTIGGFAGGGGSWGSPVATLPSGTTSYVDTSVSVGTEYEYHVVAGDGGVSDAYIYSGIQLPLLENRGKIVLLVDNSFSFDLTYELDRLQRDLVGDGWTVIRHDVSRDSTPPAIKAVIQADYAADPANVTAVFLFGHIPIAYSGWINPDGHPKRPGPTDAFYGDMHGTWTDTVNYGDSTTNFFWWINEAGDGKYDQSTLPADVDLQVGRVDFYDMPSFQTNNLYELDLLRQYLNRDHDFRLGNFTVSNQGATMTTQTGDDCMSQLFGLTPGFDFGTDTSFEIPAGSYFSDSQASSYLWFMKGTGGGEYTNDISIGNTGDFASSPGIYIVFNAFFASYYWEWDVTDSFLRAPLAANGYGLVNVWTDEPCYVLHHMALGKTIGYSTRISQNNNGYYNMAGFFTRPSNHRSIHMSLMGDPTLRMHVAQPPTGLRSFANGNSTTLRWNASLQPNLLGYNVYRASSPMGPFTRLNSNYVTTSNYPDSNPPAGTNYYMLRAVNLDASSGSGTYLNASVGIYDAKGPRVLAASDLSATQVKVIFDKPLDLATSQNPANYSLSAGVSVENAALGADQHSVLLTTTPQSDGINYVLTVNNVLDTSNPANAVFANSSVTYNYSAIPEYLPDTNTIALWHMNGDGSDASGNGYTLTLNGAATFAQQSIIGPTRQSLRVFQVGDYATVNIPGNAIQPPSGQPFTLEARIYVNEWKSYGIDDSDLISAYQNYDSYFRYDQGIWDEPANGEFTSSEAVVVDNLPAHSLIKLGEWYQIAMVYDGSNNVSAYINGQLAGVTNNPPNSGEASPFVITLGNFDGYIDEVRLSSVARDFVFQAAAPANLTASAISSSQINLAWLDVANETGFAIERWDGGAAGFVQIATTTAGVTTFNNTNLASSTVYTYRVRAVGATGLSQYSNPAVATTQPTQQSLGNGPKITPLGFSTGGNFMIHVDATTIVPYYVQASSDLTNWSNVYTNQSGGVLNFTDPAAKTTRHYYRTSQ